MAFTLMPTVKDKIIGNAICYAMDTFNSEVARSYGGVFLPTEDAWRIKVDKQSSTVMRDGEVPGQLSSVSVYHDKANQRYRVVFGLRSFDEYIDLTVNGDIDLMRDGRSLHKAVVVSAKMLHDPHDTLAKYLKLHRVKQRMTGGLNAGP